MTRTGLLLSGMMVVSTAVAALFFLRSWRRTGDRLFLIFAGGFVVMSAHWLIRGLIPLPSEAQPYFYLVRLAAFLLILVAIFDKNRRK